jgi:hypothetical protein
MNKFDNVLKQYITELNVDPKNVQQSLGSKLGNPDQQTKNALDVLGAIADSGDKDPIHQGLVKVLDPNQKEKFHEVFTNEADQAKALERLTSQGIPIGQQQSPDQNNQNNQDQNKDQQKQKNPTTPSPLSSSTGSGPVDGSTGSAGY